MDRLEGGRLARAVRAEEGDDLARADLERDALQRVDVARSRCGRRPALQAGPSRRAVRPGGRRWSGRSRGRSLAQVGLDHPGVSADLVRGALGDLLAVVEHRDPVADAHDHPHVVLDEQDRDAQLPADAGDEVGHLAGLDRVHAGRRLVEQQEARLAGERAGDLQAALVAVGQVARHLALVARRARRSPASSVPAPSGPGFLAAVAREPQGGIERRGGQAAVHARPSRSRAAVMLREQADVLERPADPERDHLVGARAAEDAGPAEHAHVPRRPDERDQQRHDDQPDARASTSSSPGSLHAAREDHRGERRGDRTGNANQKTAPPTAAAGEPRPCSPRKSIVPSRRLADAGDDVEERGLAGAVGADQADDRALRDVEVDDAHGDQAAEPLGDPPRGQRRPPGVGVAPGADGSRGRRPTVATSSVHGHGAPVGSGAISSSVGRRPRGAPAVACGLGTGPRVAAASSATRASP